MVWYMAIRMFSSAEAVFAGDRRLVQMADLLFLIYYGLSRIDFSDLRASTALDKRIRQSQGASIAICPCVLANLLPKETRCLCDANARIDTVEANIH